MMAFATRSTTVTQNEWGIELVLFSANERGDKIVAYNLYGGEGSVREFTACNPFVNHGPYLSVADVEKRVLYVTTAPEMAAGWAYKLIPMDFILKYITKRATLEELDAAAENAQKARDDLAELRASHELEMSDLATRLMNANNQASTAEWRAGWNADRADGFAQTLDRFANWIEPILAHRMVSTVALWAFPVRAAKVKEVLRARHAEGVSLAGLINGQADPVDSPP